MVKRKSIQKASFVATCNFPLNMRLKKEKWGKLVTASACWSAEMEKDPEGDAVQKGPNDCSPPSSTVWSAFVQFMYRTVTPFASVRSSFRASLERRHAFVFSGSFVADAFFPVYKKKKRWYSSNTKGPETHRNKLLPVDYKSCHISTMELHRQYRKFKIGSLTTLFLGLHCDCFARIRLDSLKKRTVYTSLKVINIEM